MFGRRTTVRARLVWGYVILGSLISVIGLTGARVIYASSQDHVLRRSAAAHDIKRLAADGSAAAEESFSYMLYGDRVERGQAFSRYDDLCQDAKELRTQLSSVSSSAAHGDLAMTVQLDAWSSSASAR
jgi:hypothetical protein